MVKADNKKKLDVKNRKKINGMQVSKTTLGFREIKQGN